MDCKYRLFQHIFLSAITVVTLFIDRQCRPHVQLSSLHGCFFDVDIAPSDVTSLPFVAITGGRVRLRGCHGHSRTHDLAYDVKARQAQGLEKISRFYISKKKASRKTKKKRSTPSCLVGGDFRSVNAEGGEPRQKHTPIISRSRNPPPASHFGIGKLSTCHFPAYDATPA